MKKIVIIAILSVAIIIATLFIPKKVRSQDEMDALVLGYPFSFYVQDFSRFTPLVFPQKFNFGSPWEDPAKILWGQFFLSYFSIFTIQYLVLTVVHHLISVLRKKNR